MSVFAAQRTISPARVRLARSLALLADFFQIVAFPLFFAGGLSPLVNVFDLVVAVIMVLLLGWHWAFVPTFVIEVVPLFDLFPTWSAAVFYVTRGQSQEPDEPPGGPGPRIKDITPGAPRSATPEAERAPDAPSRRA